MSPPLRVSSLTNSRMFMDCLTNRTDPSANTWYAPDGWKLYTSLLFVQLVWHGPGVAVPKALYPWVMYSLSRSAQPPSSWPLLMASFPARYSCGRPAHSAITDVFDV